MSSGLRKPFAWMPLVVLCSTAYGEAIVTSVSCGVNTTTSPFQTQSQTGINSCEASLGQDRSVGGNVSVGPFFISLQGSANITDLGAGGLEETASYEATILSDGPVREGFLLVDFTAFGDTSPSGGANIFVNFGPYSNYVDRNGICEYTRNVCGVELLPVTLGVPLDLHLYGNAVATIEDDSYFVDLSASLSFSFLEQDGTTVVGWTDPVSAPEPNAGWLCALGVLLVALRIRWKV
jgi:hypothetical protein